MDRKKVEEFDKIMKEYGVSISDQLSIITNGIYFDFTYGDPDPTNRNCYLNFIQVGKLLKASKVLDIDVDIDTLINESYNYKPEELVIIISKLCV